MANLRDVRVGMNVVDLNHLHVGFVAGIVPGGITVRTPTGSMRLKAEAIFGVDGGVQLICERGGVAAYELT